jgi:hypothetical protein
MPLSTSKMDPVRPFAPKTESRWRQGMIWTFSGVGSYVTHTRVLPILHGWLRAWTPPRSHGFQLRDAQDNTL